MSSKRKSGASKTATAPTAPGARVVNAIIGLPRLVRILLVALLALMVTLAISPMVDEIYFNTLFTPIYDLSPSVARVLPSLVTAAVGLTMYTLGWWLIVGTVGESPQARLAILWYVGVGILALVVVVILIIRGVTLLNFVAS